jgi:DNA-binding transcriptional MocR family regulator
VPRRQVLDGGEELVATLVRVDVELFREPLEELGPALLDLVRRLQQDRGDLVVGHRPSQRQLEQRAALVVELPERPAEVPHPYRNHAREPNRRPARYRGYVAELQNISLARGAPSLDIVAVDDLRAAADRAFQRDPNAAFSYGTSAGHTALVAWIAGKHGVEPAQVIATNGSMQADAFLFQQSVGPGDVVVVEAPTYDRTLLSLRKLGADILAIPLEADGIDVEALAEALEGGARPKLAHIIPNFQNPAGCTLSLEKRKRLLELAEKHDFLIFEDDPYVELRFAGEDLPTMLSLDDRGRVVYASSFSKTVCPGIRVGYLVGTKELIGDVRKLATETYISPSMVSQAIVAEFCESGAIDGSIETVKAALRERRDATCAALGEHMPEASFVVPEGGYFLWVDLPEGSDVDKLAAGALDRGVSFVKGSDFLLEGGDHSFRIAYSGVTPDQIGEAVGRVAEAWRELAAAAA